jgi:peptidoglycan-N-acetylglucosamine deacetylase
MKRKRSCGTHDLLCFVCLTFILAGYALPACGQTGGPWQGKKCAVVLTYDDALNTHLDNVVPLLDSLGFKGTFYVSGFFEGLSRRLKDWASVARAGHELGNHTLFHPCEGRSKGREWVNADYDLSTYTPKRMMDEIKMANTLLEAIDGKKERTFAYPCGDMKAGDSSYVGEIRKIFPGARGVQAKMQRVDEVDLDNVGAYMVNGQTGDDLIRLARQAMSGNALLVFLFHGVGGEHALNVSLNDHRALLQFMKREEGEIWVAPMVEVCSYVASKWNRQ